MNTYEKLVADFLARFRSRSDMGDPEVLRAVLRGHCATHMDYAKWCSTVDAILPDRARLYSGLCVNGPIDGQFHTSQTRRFDVPVKVGPDMGYGERGFVPVSYVWSDTAQMFICYERGER